MITFSVVEYNAGIFNKDIKFSATYNLKDLLKQDLLPMSLGSNTLYQVKSTSTNCGCASMSYYEPPEVWINLPLYGVRLLVSNRTFEEMLMSGIPR